MNTMRKNVDVAELVKALRKDDDGRLTGVKLSYTDPVTGEVVEYNVRMPQQDAVDPGLMIFLQDDSFSGHVRTGVYNSRLLLEAALHNLDDIDPQLALEVAKAMGIGIGGSQPSRSDNEFLM